MARSATAKFNEEDYLVILFFDAGTHPRHLTGGLIIIFRYVHFIWSASLDWKLIGEQKPDLVICQTIERFMQKTPKH